MKTFFQVIGAILAICAIGFFCVGVKETFTTKKVYIAFGSDVFHSDPFCPCLGVSEMDIDYMKETNNIVGSEEVSENDSWGDVALDMCTYCYSQYHIKERYDYLKSAFRNSNFDEVRMRAKEMRKEKLWNEMLEKEPGLRELMELMEKPQNNEEEKTEVKKEEKERYKIDIQINGDSLAREFLKRHPLERN